MSHTFMLHNRGPKYTKVQVCGSFSDWDRRNDMQFDKVTSQWFVALSLDRGEHVYKYVIDDKLWVVNEEELSAKDKQGNVNNIIEI